MHPLRHRRGIAAGGVLHRYAMMAAVVQVDMVHPNGCGANEFHLRALEQRSVAAGAGACEQHLCIAHGGVVYLATRHIGNLLSHRLK